MNEDMKKALSAVIKERFRQDKKWGQQDHDAGTWMLILLEEIGELSREVLQGTFDSTLEEATQVAAVALAYVENLYRIKDSLEFLKGNSVVITDWPENNA